MDGMPEIQARRSSSLSSAVKLSQATTNIERRNVICMNKILLSCYCHCYYCSCCELSSLCSVFVNSIFQYFANKQTMKTRNSLIVRQRRKRRKLLLEQESTIAKSNNVGNNNISSSMAIDTTTKTTNITTPFSSVILQPVSSQSTTYPPFRYCFSQYPTTAFDFEKFR